MNAFNWKLTPRNFEICNRAKIFNCKDLSIVYRERYITMIFKILLKWSVRCQKDSPNLDLPNYVQNLPLNASLNPMKTEDLLMPRYKRPWRNMPGEIYLKGGSKIWPLIRKMLHHPQQKIPLGACWAKHEHFCAIYQIWSLRFHLISKKLKVHRF